MSARSSSRPRRAASERDAPLANLDFRRLFCGRCVSLLGDGMFLVALAWEAYTISDGPTALALLGIAMSLPLISLLLFGGVISDRKNRRRVMLCADVLRAFLLVLMGALAAADILALWQMMVIVAVYGGAQAFFDPASDAILPEILPPSQLGEANALEQLARPLTLRLAGPALGGLLVASVGTGAAFLVDAITFLISALALWSMSTPRRTTEALTEDHSTWKQLREGWKYVRAHVWLWGTLVSAGIAYLLFMGPSEVLVPYMVKHELGGGGAELGLVLGAGGLGSVACALVMTRSGLPRRGMSFIFSVWTLATLAVAGYGLATAIWQLMLASLAFNLLDTAGMIVWATTKQQRVPGGLLGRVSSLDWLISVGLLPLSFALTAPLSAALGPRTTLVVAGLTGACATLAGLFMPGMQTSDETSAAPSSAVGIQL